MDVHKSYLVAVLDGRKGAEKLQNTQCSKIGTFFDGVSGSGSGSIVNVVMGSCVTTYTNIYQKKGNWLSHYRVRDDSISQDKIDTVKLVDLLSACNL